jgi:hypothetical protein
MGDESTMRKVIKFHINDRSVDAFDG